MLRILSVSILLNLALVFLILGSSDRAGVKPFSSPVPAIAHDSPGRSFDSPHRTVWSNLFSRNPADFAASLRAVGCPEPIVRNLVTAAINREYGSKKEELRRITDFWLDGEEKAIEVKRRVGELVQLERERESAIEAALMIPWYQAPFDNRDDYWVFFSGFVPETRGDAVIGIFMEVQLKAAMRRALAEADPASSLPGTDAELVQEFNTRLAQVMTSEEREELAIRAFEVNYFDVWKEERRFGTHLAPNELREVLRILKPELMIPPGIDNDFMKNQQNLEVDLVKGQQLRSVLGDERFAVFLQHHDGDFERTPGWSDEGKPSPEAFLQLFELKESVLQQIAALQADPAMPEAERQNALQTIAKHSEQMTLSLVPPSYYTNYLNAGGRWMQAFLETHEP